MFVDTTEQMHIPKIWRPGGGTGHRTRTIENITYPPPHLLRNGGFWRLDSANPWISGGLSSSKKKEKRWGEGEERSGERRGMRSKSPKVNW